MKSEISTNIAAVKWLAARTLLLLVIAIPTMILALLWAYGTTDLSQKFTLGSGLRIAVLITFFQTTVFCAVLGWNDVLILRRLEHARAELDRLARTDPLTGLLNRRGFDSTCAGLAETALGRPVAVLILDIDFFKKINDEHGHEFGDAALVQLAAVLREAADRSGAPVGRQGGEEFTMLLPDRPIQEAQAIAEALRQACEGRPLVAGRQSVRFTISIGLAASPGWDGDIAALAARADAALYVAKRSGRNRVVVDGDSDRAEAA